MGRIEAALSKALTNLRKSGFNKAPREPEADPEEVRRREVEGAKDRPTTIADTRDDVYIKLHRAPNHELWRAKSLHDAEYQQFLQQQDEGSEGEQGEGEGGARARNPQPPPGPPLTTVRAKSRRNSVTTYTVDLNSLARSFTTATELSPQGAGPTSSGALTPTGTTPTGASGAPSSPFAARPVPVPVPVPAPNGTSSRSRLSIDPYATSAASGSCTVVSPGALSPLSGPTSGYGFHDSRTGVSSAAGGQRPVSLVRYASSTAHEPEEGAAAGPGVGVRLPVLRAQPSGGLPASPGPGSGPSTGGRMAALLSSPGAGLGGGGAGAGPGARPLSRQPTATGAVLSPSSPGPDSGRSGGWHALAVAGVSAPGGGAGGSPGALQRGAGGGGASRRGSVLVVGNVEELLEVDLLEDSGRWFDAGDLQYCNPDCPDGLGALLDEMSPNRAAPTVPHAAHAVNGPAGHPSPGRTPSAAAMNRSASLGFGLVAGPGGAGARMQSPSHMAGGGGATRSGSHVQMNGGGGAASPHPGHAAGSPGAGDADGSWQLSSLLMRRGAGSTGGVARGAESLLPRLPAPSQSPGPSSREPSTGGFYPAPPPGSAGLSPAGSPTGARAARARGSATGMIVEEARAALEAEEGAGVGGGAGGGARHGPGAAPVLPTSQRRNSSLLIQAAGRRASAGWGPSHP